MAINFVSASNEWYQGSALAIANGGVEPWSIAIWVKKTTLATGDVFWSQATSVGSGRIRLFAQLTTGVIYFEMDSEYAITSNSISAGEWSLVVGVAASSTNRYVVLNGDWANRGINVTSKALGSMTLMAIGASAHTTAPTSPMGGSLAHLTVWQGYALTEDDINSLWAQIHPLGIHSEAVSHFWPLNGDGPADTRVRDFVGSLHVDDTVSGTPVRGDSIKLQSMEIL